MAHNPNPFDFVLLKPKATTISREEFLTLGACWSGYLTVQLTALTPIHIVGSQSGNDKKVYKSDFYRQAGNPVLPGSSIKGMLRSFIETITNGWLSQVNEEYPKIDGKTDKKNGRHIGFRLFDQYPDPLGRENRKPIEPAAYPGLKPSSSIDNLDVASWLFGYVSVNNSGEETGAVRGRVIVEDAPFLSTQLSSEQHRFPDINAEAFMGGGKPNASSWWYFLPSKVRLRKTHEVAEFVGTTLRGRKFYFHQNPTRCIAWYDNNWSNLNSTAKQKVDYYSYPAECLKPKEKTTFRIYLRDIPEQLLSLLCLCIVPGSKMRHKIGYGKAYGYGSVEFSIQEAMLRQEKPGEWPQRLISKLELVNSFVDMGWDRAHLEKLRLDSLIHQESLKKLAQILGWEQQNNLLFTYPPFNNQQDRSLCFELPVKFGQVKAVAERANDLGLVVSSSEIDVVIPLNGKKKIRVGHLPNASLI